MRWGDYPGLSVGCNHKSSSLRQGKSSELVEMTTEESG